MFQVKTGLIFLTLSLLLTNGVAAKEMSNADLNGTYYTVQALGSTSSEDTLQTVFSELIFDGTEIMTYKELNASDGVIDPAVNLDYSVATDGKLSVNNNHIQGAVSPSGDYIVLSEMPAPGGDVAPLITIGIRATADLSVRDLSGTYSMLAFGKSGGDWFSDPMRFKATLTADGNGKFELYDEWGNRFTGEYTVDPSTGRIEIVDEMGGFGFNGMLSPDGTVFSGVDTDGSDNEVFVVGGFKTGSNLSLADIDGKYYVNDFGFCSEHGYEAFYEEISVTDGIFEGVELNNTIGEEPESFSGLLEDFGDNQFLLLHTEKNQQYVYGYYTVFSPSGEIFALSDNFGTEEAFLTLGISASTKEASGDSTSDSDSGCFIQSLIR